MKERMKNYRNRIDELLANPSENTNWNVLKQEHLVQIVFFQHERLVHLIITVTFAVLTVLSIAVFMIAGYFPMLAVTLLLMILLVPYVFHYYFLENGVQHMYEQYDKISLQLYNCVANESD